jgi:hypothetical protein
VSGVLSASFLQCSEPEDAYDVFEDVPEVRPPACGQVAVWPVVFPEGPDSGSQFYATGRHWSFCLDCDPNGTRASKVMAQNLERAHSDANTKRNMQMMALGMAEGPECRNCGARLKD